MTPVTCCIACAPTQHSHSLSLSLSPPLIYTQHAHAHIRSHTHTHSHPLNCTNTFAGNDTCCCSLSPNRPPHTQTQHNILDATHTCHMSHVTCLTHTHTHTNQPYAHNPYLKKCSIRHNLHGLRQLLLLYPPLLPLPLPLARTLCFLCGGLLRLCIQNE